MAFLPRGGPTAQPPPVLPPRVQLWELGLGDLALSGRSGGGGSLRRALRRWAAYGPPSPEPGKGAACINDAAGGRATSYGPPCTCGPPCTRGPPSASRSPPPRPRTCPHLARGTGSGHGSQAGAAGTVLGRAPRTRGALGLRPGGRRDSPAERPGAHLGPTWDPGSWATGGDPGAGGRRAQPKSRRSGEGPGRGTASTSCPTRGG